MSSATGCTCPTPIFAGPFEHEPNCPTRAAIPLGAEPRRGDDGVVTALPNWQFRARGEAILRVVRELREFVAGEEVDASLHADLDEIEEVGRWLVGAVSFQIGSGIPSAGAPRPTTGPEDSDAVR